MGRFLRSPIVKFVLAPVLVGLSFATALHAHRTLDWFAFGAWCLIATVWLCGAWLDRSRPRPGAGASS